MSEANIIPLPTGAELEVTARHEAMHVVVAYLFGHTVRKVTCVRSQNANGDWREGVASFPPFASPLIDSLVALAPAAKRVGCPDSDYERAGESLSTWCGAIGPPTDDADWQRRLDALKTINETLLDAFEPMIDALTRELVARRTMTGDEVTEILWKISGCRRGATAKVTVGD